MLEKPAISDASIIQCLFDRYNVTVRRLDFLPLGADRNTAVYRAESADGDYFVNLRSGSFDETTVLVPKLLHDGGIRQVIPPLAGKSGALWTPLEDFQMILYPYIEGENGFEREVTARHWTELGQALKRIHTTALPPDLSGRIRRETFTSFYRSKVRQYQAYVETSPILDPVAAELAAFMREQRANISALVDHAERLANMVQARRLPFVLCHADIHVGNLHITPAGTLYIVDWDTMTLAPKERDLMFPGMGLGTSEAITVEAQTAYFYEGYGQAGIDATALAYYRCERIVQDAYEYCEQILFTAGDSADRAEGVRQFRSQFEPGAVVEHAFRAVDNLRSE
jgi:spectinomycin phosphotransferase